MAPVLFLSVFVIATCGLVYELVAGALASYTLGDSITQFSLIIGIYLSSMGLGSWLSRFIERDLLERFIEIELMVGLFGGSSAALLFVAFPHLAGFHALLFFLVALTGTLVGLEIPLLIRLLEGEWELKEVVSRVLSLDYVGALVASLLFPTVLLPKLGLVRTGLVFGLLNVGVGLWGTWLFTGRPARRNRLRVVGAACLVILGSLMVSADRLVSWADTHLFTDEVILKAASPYQSLVLTRYRDDVRLFINANLQFSSTDEYRYHEALVHPAMALAPDAREVLVLGGGDGFAVREVLKVPGVERVTLVDLDPQMTHLFSTLPLLTRLNQDALTDPRVHVVNADAFKWIDHDTSFWDVVIIDFPDPNNHSLGKLYSTAFYRMVKRRLSSAGVIVVQASSPFFTPRSFWTVARTLEAEGFTTLPYHAYVPSFGEWGYVLAAARPLAPPRSLRVDGLRFLDAATLAGLFQFPPDLRRAEGDINRLDNQILVQIYEDEWKKVL